MAIHDILHWPVDWHLSTTRDNDEPFEQEKIVKAEVKTGADIGDERLARFPQSIHRSSS